MGYSHFEFKKELLFFKQKKNQITSRTPFLNLNNNFLCWEKVSEFQRKFFLMIISIQTPGSIFKKF
jgi:hypothetical protein